VECEPLIRDGAGQDVAVGVQPGDPQSVPQNLTRRGADQARNAGDGRSNRQVAAQGRLTVDLFDAIEDGWHAWRSVTYDVAILDILLGSASGLDLLAKARATGLRTPVLMLTALGSVDQRVQGLERGADDTSSSPSP
jgi:DNA-binding NarL/FixJ family response regulator